MNWSIVEIYLHKRERALIYRYRWMAGKVKGNQEEATQEEEGKEEKRIETNGLDFLGRQRGMRIMTTKRKALVSVKLMDRSIGCSFLQFMILTEADKRHGQVLCEELLTCEIFMTSVGVWVVAPGEPNKTPSYSPPH